MTGDYDDDFELAGSGEKSRKRAPITPEKFAALPHPSIPCGRFTLRLTDGSTKVLRVRLERGRFATGKRTLALHQKIDNPPEGEEFKEWQTIAVLTRDGFVMMPAFKNGFEAKWAAALFALLHGNAAGGYEIVERDLRCWMTGRKLADDEAKRTGLCKTWRRNFGMQ